MGKIVFFLFVVFFVIIFPFFIKSNHSKIVFKKVTPLEIYNGVIYDYNTSLKEMISFNHLLKSDDLMEFFGISYLNSENNYSLKADKAVYNLKNRTLTGENYQFQTPEISGNGKEFKKIGDEIYATNGRFDIKD